MWGGLDHDDVAAEPMDRLRQFDADRTSAQDEQSTRHRVHASDLTVCPDATKAAEDPRDDRVGTGGDHDVVRGAPHAVDLDRAGSRQTAGAAQDVDAFSSQSALLSGVGM